MRVCENCDKHMVVGEVCDCRKTTSHNCKECGLDDRHCRCDENSMMESHRNKRITHQVQAVTWNDDGTTTIQVQGIIEPVAAGDMIEYIRGENS